MPFDRIASSVENDTGTFGETSAATRLVVAASGMEQTAEQDFVSRREFEPNGENVFQSMWRARLDSNQRPPA